MEAVDVKNPIQRKESYHEVAHLRYMNHDTVKTWQTRPAVAISEKRSATLALEQKQKETPSANKIVLTMV